MTTTEIKAELNRVKAAERTYCRARDEAEAYAQMLMSGKAVRYESDGGAHERDGNAVERAFCQSAEYNDKADKLLDEYNAIRKRAEKLISSLDDSALQEVLSRRYLIGQRWEEIAESMNYSLRRIYQLHGYALKNIALNFTISL